MENYRDIDAFKIYVSDLGLLCAKKDIVANDVLYMVEELNDLKVVWLRIMSTYSLLLMDIIPTIGKLSGAQR